MRTLAYLVIGAIFYASVTPDKPTVDKDLAPYVMSWMLEAEEHGRAFSLNVPVSFGDLKKDEEWVNAGICSYIDYFLFSVSMEIKIDRQVWNAMSEPARYAVMAHELVHCVNKVRGHPTHSKLMNLASSVPDVYNMTWGEYADIVDAFWKENLKPDKRWDR